MKFFVIAGEASGDMHGANLIKAISKLQPKATFEGFGGERLQSVGMKLLRSMDKLNFMGFVEVVANLATVRENFRICKKALTDNRPDAIILIDYPGFNLRMAKWAKQRGILVFYYISPQVWAWKENRVKKMKKHIDRLMVILPFEKEFFAKHHMDVDFVGHPLIDEIEVRHQQTDIGKEKIIALLPGSRKQEILHNLHQMVRVQDAFPDYQFIVGRAPGFDVSFYRETFALDRAIVSSEGTYSLLARSKAALVGSGTATLETALMRVPQVVCYKGNPISVALARKLIKVPYISLVNLILTRPAVKELIQGELNPKSIVTELKKVLEEGDNREKILQDYDELWDKLGSGGASERAAKLIVSDLAN
ncbi:MAG: lipid-A-disaccharide synthase [Flavobacteriales bacterium]|nr:lipid-A-disaccharide synthase [Flavobacteriales bacterium]MCB9185831.1 lipid-A-disaccharide synthase [Flavobacteriales bacterium]MCB9190622.1 lipid-A-disaccharide synthase [Flavobacteriales bacterium]